MSGASGATLSAPCRHVGSPPSEIVDRVAKAIRLLANHPDVLASHGISASEFTAAFPAAIESVRGSMSANNGASRAFLESVLGHLVDMRLATSLAVPAYGSDTVYRLEVPHIGSVAIIQKGCPDGAHSSLNWSVPDWAQETYLWWLCSSMNAHPGEHIAKGVGRLRKRFFSDTPGTLSGVIFQNELCGSSLRPCPKQLFSTTIAANRVPAPCIFSMPERDDSARSWNWAGERSLQFPSVLLEAFGISESDSPAFVGSIGFERRDNGLLRTTIATRFGAGRSSIFRG
jgi:hypothetical protein